ncbi:MAG: SpoIIE family protein phosphatase [Chloroflexi bacterium]|nr:SpoIIE family protein phosphatase [Chloroflexota bacterium]
MKDQLYNETNARLLQAQVNLNQWLETAPENKRKTCLGLQDETCVEEHLHVIDETLEKIKDGEFGVCKVCHEMVETQLLQMDYTSAVCLGHFSDEELRQLEGELQMSQIIQRGLLPKKIPSLTGMNISAFSRPAQIVGGDYFDFVDFKDGTHGIVIADVSGHGVSAGMFMSSLQTAFNTLIPETDSPISTLERINRLYIHNINFTTFVTIFLGKYDSKTRTLTYANAGHSSAYLYRSKTDEEIWLRPTGPAVGLAERFSLHMEEVKLQPGDIFILYTDGITEAANQDGQLWGEEQLANIIRLNANASAEQMIQSILKALGEYTNGAPLADDVTLVISKAV